MLPALFLCRKSKSLSEFLAERFACGCALVVGSVLDGEAVTEELGACRARALGPGLHPGAAAPAVGAEERDGHTLQMALGLGKERLEGAFLFGDGLTIENATP